MYGLHVGLLYVIWTRSMRVWWALNLHAARHILRKRSVRLKKHGQWETK